MLTSGQVVLQAGSCAGEVDCWSKQVGGEEGYAGRAWEKDAWSLPLISDDVWEELGLSHV